MTAGRPGGERVLYGAYRAPYAPWSVGFGGAG